MQEHPRWEAEFQLPWPPAKLSPNNLHGRNWATVWAAKKRYKAACLAVVREWLEAGGQAPPPGHLAATAIFHPPDARARDLDGALGSLKWSLDGTAAALGVDDRVFRPWTLDWGPVSRGAGLVFLRLTALAAPERAAGDQAWLD